MDDDQVRELEALEDILSDPNAEPIKLTYGLLKFITDNFSHEIGRGGFGVVYQGDLRHGMVAVKRSNGHNVTDKQFMDEIKCLKSTNHKNIVRFLGYCADTQEEVMPLDGTFIMAGERNRLFCFEYVSNGNIRQYLEKGKSRGDDWPTQYQMIVGICMGLRYLHDKKINHLDLKPENIMLDAHMEAKITDFGLSRFLDQGQSRIITQNIRGTLRYIAPEVIDKCELSFQSDMYSLGIIIIEVLTGTSMINLENWDESLELLDCPRARMCAEIARNCTHAERDNRPTIYEVIHRMDEMENMAPKSSTTKQLLNTTVFPGAELLDVYPLELRFLFKRGEDEMSCSLIITNNTNVLVLCILTPKDFYHGLESYRYFLTLMSSSVATVRLKAQEEIPSDKIEWEILMFITGHCDREVFLEHMSTFPMEEYATPEDAINGVPELLGGELHRAALTASVIVGSEHQVEVHKHHHGQEEETTYINKWMDVHPTELWVLCTGSDTIYIWDWQTNEKVGEFNYPPRPWNAMLVAKFIAREKWVVLGNWDGSILVHTCPTMDKIKEFKADGGSFYSLSVHPTRPFLLSLSFPLTLKLWDWSRDWSCTKVFAARSPLTQVMFNPKDTTTFATCGEDGLVEMWTIGRHMPIATTHSRDGCAGGQVFTYTGRGDCIASIDSDSKNISIWDLRKEKHVYTLHNAEDKYVFVVCHPTRPILVSVSRSKHRIEVWDSTTYRLKKAYDNLAKDPMYVGFAGSSRLVIGYKEGISILDIDLE